MLGRLKNVAFSSHFLLCKVESGMDEYEKTNEVQNNLLGETLFNLLTRYSYLRWCFFVISVTSDTYLRLHTSKESSIIDVDSLSSILSSFISGYTRKYSLRGYILGVLTQTTAWDQLWGGDETLK